MKYFITIMFVLFAFPAQASVKWVEGKPVFYTKKVVKKKIVKKRRYISKQKILRGQIIKDIRGLK